MKSRTVFSFLATATLLAGPLPGQDTRYQEVSAQGNVVRPGQRPFDDSLLSSLETPPGFRVAVFAKGLGQPRMMAVAGDGTVYVTRPKTGDVVALRDRDGDGRAEEVTTPIKGLADVHGIALHQGKLYLATVKELYAADLGRDGVPAAPRVLLRDLPDGGQHPKRTLAFGPDGMLYISVGSTCNNCDETNPEHATILRARADGSGRTVHAKGLRNTLGFAWHPETREMWGMDHGSDMRGDDLPPEELNRIEQGADYGWPFCWGDRQVDAFANSPEDKTKEEHCRTTRGPLLTYQAHAAPIGLAFYTGSQFPAEYRGDAFVAMRGSWNRKPAVGYELVRLRFENGRPVRAEPFVRGFLLSGGKEHFARLAGVAQMPDGSLLVSDDTNGVIYRISYGGGSRR